MISCFISSSVQIEPKTDGLQRLNFLDNNAIICTVNKWVSLIGAGFYKYGKNTWARVVCEEK